MNANTLPVALTPVQSRLIDKLTAAGLRVGTTAEERRNPFSGATLELPPLAVGLYDWIVSPQRGTNIANGTELRGLWDKARYLFLALFPDHYYVLID